MKNKQSFAFGEMKGNISDEDVLKQFLKVNHTGIPQSIEHINYIKSLLH